jgi:hypothetical protein
LHYSTVQIPLFIDVPDLTTEPATWHFNRTWNRSQLHHSMPEKRCMLLDADSRPPWSNAIELEKRKEIRKVAIEIIIDGKRTGRWSGQERWNSNPIVWECEIEARQMFPNLEALVHVPLRKEEGCNLTHAKFYIGELEFLSRESGKWSPQMRIYSTPRVW